MVVHLSLGLIERLKETLKWTIVTNQKTDVSVPTVFVANDLYSTLTCIIIIHPLIIEMSMHFLYVGW